MERANDRIARRSDPQVVAVTARAVAPRVMVAAAAPRPAAQDDSGKRVRLVADVSYFGVEARALRAGVERTLLRMRAEPAAGARIVAERLADDFGVPAPDGPRLMRDLAAGGLLTLDAAGCGVPTPLFHAHAKATVVAPLSRARAKVLIERTSELASRINATWHANPLRIRMIAVSGSFMSRRGHLPELTFSLILRSRPNVRRRRGRAMRRAEALTEMLGAIRAQSSFVVARVVVDKRRIPRPFAVVYQAGDPIVEEPADKWDRFRHWGASISRKLVPK